jgi:uncharacterized protein
MFPLGTVLFPSVFLPLHVFEPRYRALVHTCLEGDGCFGVTLIERGSEVGGGDVRTTVGTLAQIVEAAELADGRWALGAVGLHRIRVLRWLDDDPFPQADIEPWPDEATTTALDDRLDRVVVRLRRVLALRAELGDSVAPATVELADDPDLAAFQACAVAPLGPADRQALLEEPSAASRLERLDRLLADDELDLARQIDLGGPTDAPDA